MAACSPAQPHDYKLSLILVDRTLDLASSCVRMVETLFLRKPMRCWKDFLVIMWMLDMSTWGQCWRSCVRRKVVIRWMSWWP